MKKKTIIISIVLLIVLVIPPYIQTLWRSYKHLQNGKIALLEGDKLGAITELSKGSSFYSPLNSWAKEAATELYSFAESETDPQIKREALRELRSSYISSDLGNSIFDSRSKDILHQIEEELNLERKLDLEERPGRNIFGFLSGLTFITWIAVVLYAIFNKAGPFLILSIVASFSLWAILLILA